jgi:hypothetical protein
MTQRTEKPCCDSLATSSEAVYFTCVNRTVSSSQTAVPLLGLSGVLRGGRDAVLESVGCQDEDQNNSADEPDACHRTSDHKSLVRPAPVNVGPPDEIEHILALAREQNCEKTEDNAGHGHEHGRKGEVPSERRQFRLALHETAQTYVCGIEERVEGMILGGVYCSSARCSTILLA